MNRELIKHIVLSEFNWKKKKFFKLIIILFFSLGILPFLEVTADDLGMFVLLGFILTVVFPLSAEIISIPSGHINQSEAYSWKYLHSIIRDRKSFVLGYCLGLLPFAAAIILFFALSNIFIEYPYELFGLGAIAYFLIIVMFRLTVLRNTINFQREHYYSYHLSNFLWRWGHAFLIRLHKFFHYGPLLGIAIIPYYFDSHYNIQLTFLSFILIASIVVFYQYQSILKLWADERYYLWNFRREFPRTILHLLVFSLLVGGIVYFDLLHSNERNIFSLIDQGKTDAISKTTWTTEELSQVNGEGLTPLFYAVDKNRVEAVGVLLSKGADVNPLSQRGLSPLGMASSRCHLNMMKYLIDHGAAIDLAREVNLSPLYLSLDESDCLAGALYLIKMGANTTVKNGDGQSYLEYAKGKSLKLYRELVFALKYL